MSVVRRGSAVVVVAGLVLLGGPAWAQEDPCAPGTDGQVPLMCQGGAAPGGSDTGTVDMEPEEPCLGQPVEPGDGVVTDGGDQGIAVGEPNPGAPPSDVEVDPVAEGEAKPERVDPEQVDPATVEDTQRGPDTVICAFGGVPLSAPVADGVPESAAGGGVTAVDSSAGAANGAVSAGQLPRTGPYDTVLAMAAVGSGLLVVGAGAAAAGRRRRTGTA